MTKARRCEYSVAANFKQLESGMERIVRKHQHFSGGIVREQQTTEEKFVRQVNHRQNIDHWTKSVVRVFDNRQDKCIPGSDEGNSQILSYRKQSGDQLLFMFYASRCKGRKGIQYPLIQCFDENKSPGQVKIVSVRGMLFSVRSGNVKGGLDKRPPLVQLRGGVGQGVRKETKRLYKYGKHCVYSD